MFAFKSNLFWLCQRMFHASSLTRRSEEINDFPLISVGVNCSSLNVTNADLNTTAVLYETLVNVSCHLGYELSNDRRWTVVGCQANQTWSQYPLNCSRKLFSKSLKRNNVPENRESIAK